MHIIIHYNYQLNKKHISARQTDNLIPMQNYCGGNPYGRCLENALCHKYVATLARRDLLFVYCEAYNNSFKVSPSSIAQLQKKKYTRLGHQCITARFNGWGLQSSSNVPFSLEPR